MCQFVHCFHLETQSHLSLMCSLTQLTCGSQLWPSTTSQSSTHTHSTSLHVRVVGDQGAIHVLIRVRHRSRSSPRVFPQRFDSLTPSPSRDFSCTIRSTSVCDTFLFTTILWMIAGSTQLSVVFDDTWNSSMMFSSTLTVVQSSDDSLVLLAACACRTLKHPLSDSFTSSCP